MKIEYWRRSFGKGESFNGNARDWYRISDLVKAWECKKEPRTPPSRHPQHSYDTKHAFPDTPANHLNLFQTQVTTSNSTALSSCAAAAVKTVPVCDIILYEAPWIS